MRIGCSLLLGLMLACAPTDEQPDPIDDQFWVTAGGWTVELSMYRDGDQIELWDNGLRSAQGTLTPAGLTAWSDAVASIDPNAVGNLPRCAPSDGIDTCVEVDPEDDGELLEVCYCADDPPPEVTQLDAYFAGLATALLECKPSEHIVIDLCG